MPTPLSSDTLNQIQAAVNRGDLISAIKTYREATGEGLYEAKTFVESMKGNAFQLSSPPDPDRATDRVDAEVEQAIFAGNLIAAIRRHREVHPGMGLAQAKQEVEAHAQQLRAQHPDRVTGPLPRSVGCGAGLLLLSIVVALVLLGLVLMRVTAR